MYTGYVRVTLLGTNLETHKGPYKDYSPSKMGLYGFPCLFGGVYREYIGFEDFWVLGLRT